MSDELELKRQEKIKNFKINFGDESIEENEISSTTHDGAAEAEDSEINPVAEVKADNTIFEDISGSGNDDGSEINSFSEKSASETKVIDKKSLRQAKRTDKRRRRKKSKKNRIIFRVVWLTMVVFTSIMIGEFLMVGVNDVLGVGREEKKVTITVPKDVSLDEITDILMDNHVINTRWSFKLFATLTKATSGFTQGTFEVDTNKDYQALINYLQSDLNRTDQVRGLAFFEGETIKDYAKRLEENKVCSADEFLEKCNSDDFDEYPFIKSINNSSKRKYKLEGYLFPDTYDFFVGEDVDTVIRKFLANYRKKMYATKTRVSGFEKKVTIEERAKKLGMTMEDVLVMASLIQAEAADSEDMIMISSILHNRLETLKNGGVNANGESGLGYLQLDSTRYYPYKDLTEVPESDKRKYTDENGSYHGPYSTYKHEGLPDTPICNPGLDAIEAVLSPEKTDNYYFCHKVAKGDEEAVAYYAKTMEEHTKNLIEAGLL